MNGADLIQLESHQRHSRNKAREKLFFSKSDSQPKQVQLILKKMSKSSSLPRGPPIKNSLKNDDSKAEINMDLVQSEYQLQYSG